MGLFTFVVMLPSVTCFVSAGVLCYQGRDGWGWFLVVGVLVSQTVRYRKG